jgi:hypothetical protein
MQTARSIFGLLVPAALATFACSSSSRSVPVDAAGVDAASPCPAQFSASDTGQPATITVDTSAVVNSFQPKLLFGINSAWFITQRDSTNTQAKVQGAGNYFIRYPGGSSSDDYHWNGTGRYDEDQHWVPSQTTFTPGFPGTETYRGTTSGSYQTPALVTDGDPSTRWLSNPDTAFPEAQWVYVDLGAAASVNSIQIVWGMPYATSFQIQTWSSLSTWPAPYQASGGTWQSTSAGIVTGTGGTQAVPFDPVSARFFRVLLTASSAGPGGAYSIAEITAYNGATQVTTNVATMSQSPTTASSTDPASAAAPQSNFDFESFMTYARSFTPAADPIVTVNVGTGTPQEAAAWVHYANVVKGYGIRYWQIGNEMDGDWETGGPLNAQDYVNRYVEYYDAMKAEDPSLVVLGPVSTPTDPSNLGDGKTFIQDFISLLHAGGMDDHVDGIDFHWYPNWQAVSDSAALATISQLGDFAASFHAWLSGTTVRANVPVFLTEYNIGLGSPNTPVYVNQLVNGLWVANALGEFIRYFGNGGGTNLWNIMGGSLTPDTSDPSAGDLGYLQHNGNTFHYQERADYWAMQMMSSDWAIAGDTRMHQLVATTTSQPSLATYADLRPDGALSLVVVNRDEVNAYSARIDVAPFVPDPAADVWTFDASHYVWKTLVKPYHAEPDTAPTHTLTCGASPSTPFTFSPASITVIRFAPPGGPTAVIPDAGSPPVAADGSAVPTYVLIDDMEGTTAPNGPIELDPGVTGLTAGYWWDWHSTGKPSDTMSPDPFAYSALTSPHETMSGITSAHAAHVACLIADLYGYCEQGFDFAQRASAAGPERIFNDISAHTGIVFWGMSPVANRVKVMIQNIDTDVAGGRCGQNDAAAEQCWDNFSTYVDFTNTWQRFEVKFSDLSQEGWGHQVPSGIFDATTAFSLYFQVNGPANATAAPVTADFWVDDVYFE